MLFYKWSVVLGDGEQPVLEGTFSAFSFGLLPNTEKGYVCKNKTPVINHIYIAEAQVRAKVPTANSRKYDRNTHTQKKSTKKLEIKSHKQRSSHFPRSDDCLPCLLPACPVCCTFSPCQVHHPTVPINSTVEMMTPKVFILEDDTSSSAHGLQATSGWLDSAYQQRNVLKKSKRRRQRNGGTKSRLLVRHTLTRPHQTHS